MDTKTNKIQKNKHTHTGIWKIHLLLNNFFKSVYLQTYISTCKGLIEGRTVGLKDRQDKGKVVHYMS